MPKKVKKLDAPLDNEKLALLGIDFFNKKQAIKELETQCKEIRKPLEEAAMSSGRSLASGSKVLVLSHADADVHVKETLRVGKVLLPEAFDVLRENGFDECIENVPTIREDVIERLYDSGKLSDEILQKIYASKHSYAFSVEVKSRFEG